MKKIKIYGIDYAIEECTAIAICDDENEDCRQKALLITDESISGEKFEFIVFGWPVPENDEDFNDMLDDGAAWEPLTDSHHCKK